MTNLQHHLRGIRKIIRKTVQTTESDFIDVDILHAKLREYLPKSYGIARGHLTDGYHESEMLPIIIYDVPLSEGKYDASSTLFDIQHVLFVADIASSHTNKSLRQSLDLVASIKKQNTGRKRTQSATTNQNVTQVRFRVPADRLPYTLIVFNDFTDYPLSDLSLFERIYRIMADVDITLHPDEMQLLSQPVHYLNPLLEHDDVKTYDSGLTRTPFLAKPRDCYICKRDFFPSALLLRSDVCTLWRFQLQQTQPIGRFTWLACSDHRGTGEDWLLCSFEVVTSRSRSNCHIALSS